VSARESSIEESRADLTRAAEHNGLTAVSFTVKRKTFYFAVSDTEITYPEGYTKAELNVNKQEVLALKNDQLGENVYLVYGFLGKEKEAGWYFFDSKTEEWMAYEKIFGEVKTIEPSDETGSDDSTETQSGSGDSRDQTQENPSGVAQLLTKNPILTTVLAFVLGLGIAGIVVYLLAGKKAKAAGLLQTDDGETPETGETLESVAETAAETVYEPGSTESSEDPLTESSAEASAEISEGSSEASSEASEMSSDAPQDEIEAREEGYEDVDEDPTEPPEEEDEEELIE
jgi:hypothetical protein